jgi:RNA polymerase sigma-70 factor (ECF subfamily)
LPNSSQRAQFERAVLPHLDAAYNLARWLTRNDHDAQDILQDACVRAFRHFGGFHGGNARAWLLTIVRHTGYSWLEQNRGHVPMTPFDEQIHSPDGVSGNGGGAPAGPEALLRQKRGQQQVQRCLEELPVEFREVMILRELEGLSYKEIGAVAAIPIGTVMSRLSRGRDLLQRMLIHAETEDG